jgi:hypothetical protein
MPEPGETVAQGEFLPWREFLTRFNRGETVVYYRGESLGADVESHAAAQAYRDRIWAYVIDCQRGTFFQKRIGPQCFEYRAIPIKMTMGVNHGRGKPARDLAAGSNIVRLSDHYAGRCGAAAG